MRHDILLLYTILLEADTRPTVALEVASCQGLEADRLARVVQAVASCQGPEADSPARNVLGLRRDMRHMVVLALALVPLLDKRARQSSQK